MPGDTKQVTVRLRPDELSRLEKKAKAITPTVPTNEFQAAFACGVQHVIDLLREGFTVAE